MLCRKWLRHAVSLAFACSVLLAGAARSASAQCALNSPSGKIKHVVYIEFDNVHFTRDNPNVPSDLEQMPNLKQFIEQNGTLNTGDHAILISHTANDILTTQDGLYSDHQGIFVSNSFGVFSNTSTGENGLFPSAFFYWTDKVSDITPATGDNTFALTTPSGQNVPAPWVPFTRAGCTVGAFSTANIVLERAPFDIVKVFGAGSPQALESSTNQNNDFIGAAIHCALNDPICKTSPNAVADMLTTEPGGYSGYQALFGLKYVNPALGFPGGIPDYHGVPLTGFNQLNFDPTPAQTLAVVETMLKANIPVVYAYIADAHDNQEESSISSAHTFGPGEAGYTAQLADYNSAFGTFLLHLKEAGIDASNTLFILTPDEGDHFVGGAPTPANCDGAKVLKSGEVVPDVPCTYGTNGVGEVQLNILAATQAAGDPTVYGIHFDDAVTTYVNGQPLADSPSVRSLEKTMAGLSAVNPHDPAGSPAENLMGTGLGPNLQGAIVDPVGMRMLHMDTAADPNREPTFTMFGNPNFFFQTTGSASPVVGTGFAWNHGDIQPDIARTFIAMAGPGVKKLGVTEPHDFFTDHVDVRPTMMALLGLKDDYQQDGRVVLEMLDGNALPQSLHAHHDTLLELGKIYKEIDAPFGKLAKDTLAISTYAITSTSTGDEVFNTLENKIAGWTAERDELAAQMNAMLQGAEFQGAAIDERAAQDAIEDGEQLLDKANDCAANLERCARSEHGHDRDDD